MKNKWYLLAISLALLNMTDCVTTLLALQHKGISEVNPIMRFVLGFGPIPFILVKLLASSVGFVMANKINESKASKPALIIINCIYFLVVVNNLLNLALIKFHV